MNDTEALNEIGRLSRSLPDEACLDAFIVGYLFPQISPKLRRKVVEAVRRRVTAIRAAQTNHESKP